MGKKKKKNDNNTVEHDGMPTPITDDEWADYSESYVKLTRANAYITSPECYDGYNCVGWSIQDLTYEDDIETVVKMVKFYKSRGYEELTAGSADATIDLWASSGGYQATHASRKYDGPKPGGMPAGLWESKLYPGVRMTHGRDEIECEIYGTIVKSFRKSAV